MINFKLLEGKKLILILVNIEGIELVFWELDLINVFLVESLIKLLKNRFFLMFLFFKIVYWIEIFIVKFKKIFFFFCKKILYFLVILLIL